MLSLPAMRPLAMDGAAPMTTTNMIACSESWNSRIARGNQAIDGMVWMPVMRDPKATRSTLIRATRLPITTPMTRART